MYTYGNYKAKIISGGSGYAQYSYAKFGHLVILSGAWWAGDIKTASGADVFVLRLPWNRVGGDRHIGTMGYSSYAPTTSTIDRSRQYPVISISDRFAFCAGTYDLKGSEIANMTFQWTLMYITGSTGTAFANAEQT